MKGSFLRRVVFPTVKEVKNLNPCGLMAEPNEFAFLNHLQGVTLCNRQSEVQKRSSEPVGVFLGPQHPQIEIRCISGYTVKGKCVCTDNHELNAVVRQGSDKISEVLIQIG